MRAWRSGRGPSAAPRITALARDKLTTARYVYRYSNVCRKRKKEKKTKTKKRERPNKAIGHLHHVFCLSPSSLFQLRSVSSFPSFFSVFLYLEKYIFFYRWTRQLAHSSGSDFNDCFKKRNSWLPSTSVFFFAFEQRPLSFYFCGIDKKVQKFITRQYFFFFQIKRKTRPRGEFFSPRTRWFKFWTSLFFLSHFWFLPICVPYIDGYELFYWHFTRFAPQVSLLSASSYYANVEDTTLPAAASVATLPPEPNTWTDAFFLSSLPNVSYRAMILLVASSLNQFRKLIGIQNESRALIMWRRVFEKLTHLVGKWLGHPVGNSTERLCCVLYTRSFLLS